MRRYLIVANQTLGGDPLLRLLRERMAAGPCRFHVIVPATHPREHTFWSEGEAIAVAEAHLDDTLARFRAEGATVSGEIGDASPVEAVDDVLLREEIDEIIVSTLPPGPSRWIRQDVAHRIERHTGLPVRHVVCNVREPQVTR